MNVIGHVLTTCTLYTQQLAHEDDNEDMRMTASELLNLLAELLGHDLCKQFVIPEVVSLAEDPVFRVRKSTALNFQNVCKVGGEYELFERLMPAFVRLSKDDMYRVRRACAESLCEISKHVSDDIRAGVLVEIFLRLAQDPSKLVKQSVLQQSGMFISTLPKRVISKVILDHYCNMVNSPTGDMAVDAELKHYCAFSFPGVLQTVGVERWSELRQVYHTLVRSPNPNVKQTLALSLHEVARILGMRLAEEELVAVFEEMIQDSENVKMGVIKHMADFLRLLSMPCRVSYLPLLADIIVASSPFNWRLRRSLASQLSELVLLPPPQNVYGTLFPLAMTLVQDPVAEVRKESFRGVAKMLRVLEPGHVTEYPSEEGLQATEPLSQEEGEQYLNNVARAINALVLGETYHHRQLWANLSLELLKELPREIFEKHFLGGILLLTSDSVANVRVSVAEMLTGWAPTFPAPWEVEDSALCPWKWLLERGDIRECVERLSKEDNDVVLNMSKLQPLFPDMTFVKMTCVGLKRAPGGVVPVGKDLAGGVQRREIGAGDDGDSSSDASFGGDGDRSLASSISSCPGGGLTQDESFDSIATDGNPSLPPLQLSSPAMIQRSASSSPPIRTGPGMPRSPEDILVDEVDFMDRSGEVGGLPVTMPLGPSPLARPSHMGHALSDDEEEYMALQEAAAGGGADTPSGGESEEDPLSPPPACAEQVQDLDAVPYASTLPPSAGESEMCAELASGDTDSSIAAGSSAATDGPECDNGARREGDVSESAPHQVGVDLAHVQVEYSSDENVRDGNGGEEVAAEGVNEAI